MHQASRERQRDAREQGDAEPAWAVDARYRSYSLRIMSCLMKQKEIDLFACTTVSSASEPSYRDAFRFSKASAGTWDNASFWITNYRGFSKSA